MQKQKFKQTEIGMIPEYWEIKKLRDICIDISYGYTASAKLKEVGPKFLRITDIQNEFINWRDVPYCEINEEDHKKYKLEQGDIVIARTGASTGTTKIIQNNVDAIFASYLIRYKINKKIANPFFVGFVLKSDLWKSHVESVIGGSAQPGANAKQFGVFELPLPTLEEQGVIVTILSNLDSKIELNHQMNKTLEAIGQAIFKHWFIDFEFLNEKGKPYKSSGGEMVDSELGEIPKGWGVGIFVDEFNLTMGQSPPGSSYNETGDGIIFFQGRSDFGFRYPKNRIYCNSPTRLAEKNSTLLSVRAPVGDLNMALERCCIGRGLAAIIHKSKSRSYTYYMLRYIQPQLESFDAEGTVFGSVNKDNLNKVKIIIPNGKLIEKFEELIFPIDESIENNQIASENLSQIRDSLLPKLMSGKIRVPVEVKR